MKTIMMVLIFSALVVFPSLSQAEHRHHGHHRESSIHVGIGFGYPSRYYYDPYYSVYDPYYAPIIVREPVIYRPVTYVQAPETKTVEVTAPVTTEPMDTFTVNVPNGKGAYTAVVIKKSGKGFTGPQGEFYDEFPKVAQLQAMYGK